MPFHARLFRLAKEAEHPELNQDACRVDVQGGVAVIADGATSGIFSRRWAMILADRVMAGLPEVDDPAAFSAWLAECRREWDTAIDTSCLAWHQKAKLRDGAFATLLWVEAFPVSDCEMQPGEPASQWFLTARAVGDSCLFLVRDGRLEASFPIQSSEELRADPLLLGSLDLNHDRQLAFSLLETECRSGDLIVLCTDAVADWALRHQEAGDAVAWEEYWDMPRQVWMEEILLLREQGKMRYDDSTLLLLRVGPDAVQPEDADVLPDLAPSILADAVDAPPAEPFQANDATNGPIIDARIVDPVASDSSAAEPQPSPRSAPSSSPETETPPQRADWREKLDSVKEKADQITGKVVDTLSEQFDRGMGKLQDALGGAEEVLKNYRRKRQEGKTPEEPSDDDQQP